MIRSLLALALAFGGVARAQEAEPGDAEEASDTEADPLSPHRTKFDVLTERTIGTASKPVAFNWRRTNAMLAVFGTFPFELNNFNHIRGGALLRVPTGGSLLFELGATYAHSWDSPSSELLALTPYRQPGRPNRADLDIGVAYPLAEGVVTAASKLVPGVQMVLNGYVNLRYSVYPAGWGNMRPSQVIGAIFNPTLTEIELENLDDNRLDAMQIDTGRYGLLAGFGTDLYFSQGLFVSPRVLFAVPVLAPASGTNLLFYADFELAVGLAF